eukprot:Rmarinus@m.27211
MLFPEICFQHFHFSWLFFKDRRVDSVFRDSTDGSATVSDKPAGWTFRQLAMTCLLRSCFLARKHQSWAPSLCLPLETQVARTKQKQITPSNLALLSIVDAKTPSGKPSRKGPDVADLSREWWVDLGIDVLEATLGCLGWREAVQPSAEVHQAHWVSLLLQVSKTIVNTSTYRGEYGTLDARGLRDARIQGLLCAILNPKMTKEQLNDSSARRISLLHRTPFGSMHGSLRGLLEAPRPDLNSWALNVRLGALWALSLYIDLKHENSAVNSPVEEPNKDGDQLISYPASGIESPLNPNPGRERVKVTVSAQTLINSISSVMSATPAGEGASADIVRIASQECGVRSIARRCLREVATRAPWLSAEVEKILRFEMARLDVGVPSLVGVRANTLPDHGLSVGYDEATLDEVVSALSEVSDAYSQFKSDQAGEPNETLPVSILTDKSRIHRRNRDPLKSVGETTWPTSANEVRVGDAGMDVTVRWAVDAVLRDDELGICQFEGHEDINRSDVIYREACLTGVTDWVNVKCRLCFFPATCHVGVVLQVTNPLQEELPAFTIRCEVSPFLSLGGLADRVSQRAIFEPAVIYCAPLQPDESAELSLPPLSVHSFKRCGFVIVLTPVSVTATEAQEDDNGTNIPHMSDDFLKSWDAMLPTGELRCRPYVLPTAALLRPSSLDACEFLALWNSQSKCVFNCDVRLRSEVSEAETALSAVQPAVMSRVSTMDVFVNGFTNSAFFAASTWFDDFLGICMTVFIVEPSNDDPDALLQARLQLRSTEPSVLAAITDDVDRFLQELFGDTECSLLSPSPRTSTASIGVDHIDLQCGNDTRFNCGFVSVHRLKQQECAAPTHHEYFRRK